MKYIYHLAALSVVGLFCAGCVPERVTISPGASGQVLDAATRDEIPGATVVMTYSKKFGWADNGAPTLAEAMTNARPPVAITGEYGQFSIPREHIWVIDRPMPEWHAYGTLIILKDGYEPTVIPASDTNDDLVSKTFLLTPVKGEPKEITAAQSLSNPSP